MPQTPYTQDLGDRDPIVAMRETSDRIRALVRTWSAQSFEQSYAAGKWTARQILIHLAQTEMALGVRVRMALATPQYVAQPFDQDPWVALDFGASAREALEAFVAVSRMNVALFESLSPTERAIGFSHPEYGALTVDWVIHQMAGHQIHHCKQLDTIASL